MKRIAIILAFAFAVFAAAPKKRVVNYDKSLPPLGTKFHTLPDGKGKELVETSCLPCHSADILAQQRLTEKQWTATVEKMMRWGAVVKDDDKAPMIAYLAKHFSVDNHSFTPARTRPVGF